jgi:uncharacterized membrane protein
MSRGASEAEARGVPSRDLEEPILLPEPLHPAIVHFPIALSVLAPLLAVIAAVAIRAGRVSSRAWAAVVLCQVLLAGASWLAVETGEREEEEVEDVVGERNIHEHEEAAERFLLIAGVTAAVSAGGLLAGPIGGAARLATVAAGAAVVAAGIAVGHSGGELVYRHGAASAYVEKAGAGEGAASAAARGHREEEEHEEEGEH